MKRMKIMVAAIALCGLAACSDNTPKSFTGTITDASMNTVTVENAEGTFTFSTMDADKSEANGLLLGAPVTVNYSGKLEELSLIHILFFCRNITYYSAQK